MWIETATRHEMGTARTNVPFLCNLHDVFRRVLHVQTDKYHFIDTEDWVTTIVAYKTCLLYTSPSPRDRG
eukprot:2609472-Amphidinium_carterae.1